MGALRDHLDRLRTLVRKDHDDPEQARRIVSGIVQTSVGLVNAFEEGLVHFPVNPALHVTAESLESDRVTSEEAAVAALDINARHMWCGILSPEQYDVARSTRANDVDGVTCPDCLHAALAWHAYRAREVSACIVERFHPAEPTAKNAGTAKRKSRARGK
jgi:hypothetical protein